MRLALCLAAFHRPDILGGRARGTDGRTEGRPLRCGRSPSTCHPSRSAAMGSIRVEARAGR
jgi:hypothetical protein